MTTNQHANKRQAQPNKHKWKCPTHPTPISTFVILAQKSQKEFKSFAFTWWTSGNAQLIQHQYPLL
jgi:hypothetical protein